VDFFSGYVYENRKISEKCYLMKIETPVLLSFLPGQFIMIRGWKGYDPLLPRPFAIYSWKEEGGKKLLTFIYKVVGRGTSILSGLHVGDEVQVNAPLGNGFSPVPGKKKYILAGGGVGFSTVLPVARLLTDSGMDVRVIIGARTAGEIPRVGYIEEADEEHLLLTTDDGSVGVRGLVTDYLEKELGNLSELEDVVLFACGPPRMLKKVQELSKESRIETYLCLENYMACGFGVCLGCVVNRNVEGTVQKVRVCREGPVFKSDEVEIDD